MISFLFMFVLLLVPCISHLYLWHFLNRTLPLFISFPVFLPFLLSHNMCCFLLLFFAVYFTYFSSPFPSLPVRPQALLVRALLEYSQSSVSSVPYGLSLAAGIFLMELMRSWSLALMWAVNYRTAARLRGAALTFAFHKILRLRSTKDIGTGEVGDIILEGTHLQIN